MKCIKCGKMYDAGAHYCSHCGAMTAEGELSLALTDFAKAAKNLVKQTAKIGDKHLKELKPDINRAIKQVVEAGNEMKEVSKPAAKTGFEAARTALQLAAQAAENMAMQLRKASEKR